MRTRTIAAAAVTAAALGALAAAPVAATGAIVPGKSVAGVALGDTAAKVKRVLGAPDAGSNLLNYRYIRRHGLGIYFVAGRVLEISVLRRPQATAAGIRVGSTRKALDRAHPRATCRDAVVGARTVECRQPARMRGRTSETVFTLVRGRVTNITVRFA